MRMGPDGDYVMEIPLSGGAVALVSGADYDALAGYEWSKAGSDSYPRAVRKCRETDRQILMHRQIMNAPRHLVVDHIDGNPLNNTRPNLRLATPSQNTVNAHSVWGSSRYRGVCRDKHRGRWVARIKADGKHRSLGSFKDEVEAAAVYWREARAAWGEFFNDAPFMDDALRARLEALGEAV